MVFIVFHIISVSFDGMRRLHRFFAIAVPVLLRKELFCSTQTSTVKLGFTSLDKRRTIKGFSGFKEHVFMHLFGLQYHIYIYENLARVCTGGM